MNVDQHIWRNPYPLIAVLSTPQRCLELSGCPAENEHIKHTVRADLKRQLRGTSHYKQCHLSLFSLHMAKQLCFSPLLGILLHSSILHKWEQRALWFCCLAALLVNRGHWDTWGNLITAFTRRLVNCKDGCFCCWITLQRWKYGREKKTTTKLLIISSWQVREVISQLCPWGNWLLTIPDTTGSN